MGVGGTCLYGGEAKTNIETYMYMRDSDSDSADNSGEISVHM